MKRLLALLLASLCLFTLIACTNEPLPEKPADELMKLAVEKMQTYASYGLDMTLTASAKSGTETLKQEQKYTIRNAVNGDAYLRSVSQSEGAGSSMKNTMEITMVGEDAYVNVDALGMSQKFKMARDEVSEGTEMPTLEELMADISAESFADATVTTGTSTWTVTFYGEMQIPGTDLSDATVSNAVTTIVIGRSYTIRSITITFDFAQDGMTGTVKATINFSHLGSTRVSAPRDADTYEEMT